jgi:hypothetical protein
MAKKERTIIIRITQEQHIYLMQWGMDCNCSVSETIRDLIQKEIERLGDENGQRT